MHDQNLCSSPGLQVSAGIVGSSWVSVCDWPRRYLLLGKSSHRDLPMPMQACNCNKAVLSLASSQQTDAGSVATRENI